jgi:hypothetical protein
MSLAGITVLSLRTHKPGPKSPDLLTVPVQNLDRLERDLAAVQARLERLEALVLSPDAGAFLAQLAASTSGRVFSVRELRQHATVDPALAATLAHFRSPKGLGRFLRELSASPPPGAFTLERVLRERTGWLWKVSARE